MTAGYAGMGEMISPMSPLAREGLASFGFVGKTDSNGAAEPRLPAESSPLHLGGAR